MSFLRLAAFVAVLCIASRVYAEEKETIALLPLDADKRLQPFGQPLAAEIGRVLIADKLDVVVVAATNTVPASAKLVVYGALVPKKGDEILVQINVRDPSDGVTTDTLEEIAPSLLAIEATSIKLSKRLAPVVRARLAALHKVAVPDRQPDKIIPPPQPMSEPVLLVGIAVPAGASGMIVPFRAALTGQIGGWVKASKRTPAPVDASVLGKQLAAQTVASARAERGVSFEILDYDVQLTGRPDGQLLALARPGAQNIPLARARVRVRIADARKVVFDRVIATDTVVGDRQITGDALAERVAREVLTILRPHMRRLEPTWR